MGIDVEGVVASTSDLAQFVQLVHADIAATDDGDDRRAKPRFDRQRRRDCRRA
jgi:hypothetical protein